MEHIKVRHLFGKTTSEVPRFVTNKWVEIFDQSNGSYNPNKDIRFKIPQLRSDLCDINDAYIVVTGKITATNPGNNNLYNKKLAMKNCAPFFNCILKINNQLIEDAQDLDVAMLMYNLLYSSKNFRKTTGSFWNYYPDIPNSACVGNNARTRILYQTKNSESFNYKTKFVGSVVPGANDNPNNVVETELEDVKTVVPLKNLSNFMFNLDILLINAEIELILKWSQNCVLTEKATREHRDIVAGPHVLDEMLAKNRPKDLKFDITGCKLYVPIVTLQAEYENKLHEELKTGIKIDFTWNKYRTQIINQTATNNLNYLIDPTFNSVNRPFVLAFPNEEDRSSFSKYYTPTVEIKGYNVILDGQRPFYDMPVEIKEKLTR